MAEQEVETLSSAALADLEQDHENHADPKTHGPSAFAEPASEPTALGRAAVANAVKFLQLPLRENAGVNQDSAGHIRTFFLEGLKWNPKIWDQWIEKHPKSVVIKPEWCAAFGSYCVRTAYEAAGKTLPSRLSASASEMKDYVTAAGRFLPRTELFTDDGKLREDPKRLPGAGDLVVFQGHVGLLRELYTDGAFVTIEGNTYTTQPRHDGVYQVNRNAAQKKADGSFRLVGFCLLPSVDGK